MNNIKMHQSHVVWYIESVRLESFIQSKRELHQFFKRLSFLLTLFSFTIAPPHCMFSDFNRPWQSFCPVLDIFIFSARLGLATAASLQPRWSQEEWSEIWNPPVIVSQLREGRLLLDVCLLHQIWVPCSGSWGLCLLSMNWTQVNVTGHL